VRTQRPRAAWRAARARARRAAAMEGERRYAYPTAGDAAHAAARDGAATSAHVADEVRGATQRPAGGRRRLTGISADG
jgi:hypothetical protein